MSLTHIAESLIEVNKKISEMIDQAEHATASDSSRDAWISDLNTIIRKLDHIVESLEKTD